MTHSLDARHVTFGYEPKALVLDGVDAVIRSGELTVLVGPNGSGKSTLLRILCGLLKPSSGQVLLDDKSLSSFSGRERARRIAFLPELVNPIFALSVFEVVCLGRYPHGGAWGTLQASDLQVALRCLEDTECEVLRERSFMTLSGGERQRVLLAGILAQEPDLLLLDEPTSALDLHHAIEIFSLLKRLSRNGYGIAVVTHDLNMGARFCDRLVLLSSARKGVLASGPPEEVLTEALLSEAYASPIRVCEHPITRTPLVTAVIQDGQGPSGGANNQTGRM